MNDTHMPILMEIKERIAKIEEHLRNQNKRIEKLVTDVDKNTGFRNWLRGGIAGLGILSTVATIIAIISYLS